MLRWLRQLAPPLVAIVLLGMLPLAAHATAVTYSTSGAFSTPGSGNTDIAVNFSPDGLLKTQSGQTKLLFSSQGSTSISAPANNVALGTITMTASNASQMFDTRDLFSLTISQSVPGNVNGSTSANIVGSVIFTPATSGGTDAGTLTLAFSPNPVILNGIAYTIQPFNLNFNVNQPGGAVGTIQATVAAVPLPQTATMGIALIGCIGGFGAWRRMKSEDGALA